MPQAVRNGYTCKQDLPNSNFKASRTLRSIQDDPAEYRFEAITAQGREEDRFAGRPDASKVDRASVFARGAQYTYRGHVVYFLRNVDIVLLRPPTTDGDPRLQQQFIRNFQVHRSCLEAPQGPAEEAAEEDQAMPTRQRSQICSFTETELNALQYRILNDTPDRELATDLEQMPRSAQNQHQMPFPSIRRTPINEFNHSQPLLSLAFPTLYPDFVEPRLRTITYQDYLAHAMRWRDGRFACHKTWPFVALNALLRAQLSTTRPGLRAHKLPTLAWWKMIFVRPAVLLLPGELPFTRERANVVSFSEAATARWPLFHFFAGFIKLAHCVVGMNACPALLVPSSWGRAEARIQGQNIICNLVFLNTLRQPARSGLDGCNPT
ncbi:hypothetical protein MHUMG1_08895 [Metarhizium humberi]|uniref:ATP-dependent DNA helicase PIF1 n=1 Tax=Metarhizium humberi TaxID=2596975 RepID=A0A9P8M460_9HYPO|nr:hypothetical protein MHUMG1_08895 [Metarhizium humberi]